MNELNDKLAERSGAVDLTALQFEWSRCKADAQYLTRMGAAEEIRFAWWPGKTDDGLKHQDAQPDGSPEVKPWDNCSDVEERLADDVINSLVDLVVSAFWNARIRTQPATVSKLNAAQCAELRVMIGHVLHGGGKKRMVRTVERAAQAQFAYGCAILAVLWRREEKLRKQKITMQQLVQYAQVAAQQQGQQSQQSQQGAGSEEQGAGSPLMNMLPQVPLMIMDETQEASAIAVLQSFVPHLKTARARTVVRDLRKTGEAEFPVPFVAVDRPEVRVLLPFIDVFWPPETVDIERARVVFERRFMTAAEVLALAREMEWDQQFTDAVVQTAGSRSVVDGLIGFAGRKAEEQINRIEILWAYQKAVDEDDIEGVYVTCFSPHVHDQYAYSDLLDYAHGEMPFVPIQTEYAGERMEDARGVPDQCGVLQAEVKSWRDLARNHLTLALGPSIFAKVTKGMEQPKIAPMALNIVTGDPGAGVRWMEAPGGNPGMAIQVGEMLGQKVSDYFGLLSVNGHQTKAQMRQQRITNNWLMAWTEVLWQMACLAYQHWDPAQLEAILGRPALLSADLVRDHRPDLWFDVRALDADWVIELTKALQTFVLPLDAGGVIDRAKLIQVILSYFEPTLADEITTDQQAASQALFERVKNDVLQMAAGNECAYVENDPTAKAQLGYAQQIVQANPKYQQALQSDPRFKLLFQKWLENRQQSVVQDQNKMTGRIGVTPMDQPNQNQ